MCDQVDPQHQLLELHWHCKDRRGHQKATKYKRIGHSSQRIFAWVHEQRLSSIRVENQTNPHFDARLCKKRFNGPSFPCQKIAPLRWWGKIERDFSKWLQASKKKPQNIPTIDPKHESYMILHIICETMVCLPIIYKHSILWFTKGSITFQYSNTSIRISTSQLLHCKSLHACVFTLSSILSLMESMSSLISSSQWQSLCLSSILFKPLSPSAAPNSAHSLVLPSIYRSLLTYFFHFCDFSSSNWRCYVLAACWTSGGSIKNVHFGRRRIFHHWKCKALASVQ